MSDDVPELQRRYLQRLADGTRANGRHYGYPPCCIEHYVHLFLASAPAWEDHLHDGEGGVIAWASASLRYPEDPIDPSIPQLEFHGWRRAVPFDAREHVDDRAVEDRAQRRPR
jgi:hypothetical protein